MTDLALYRRLFVHRADVFAQQREDGGYTPVLAPLTDDDLLEHLEGFVSYGVYVVHPGHRPMNCCGTPGPDCPVIGAACTIHREAETWPPNTVAYIVFDLDTYDVDALDLLCRQVERLVPDNPKCLLLEDSGGKGYHLWLLLSQPAPAAQVREWSHPVRQRYEAMRRTAPDWPPLEIFPKQDEVAEGAYGNLVKLPFGVHAKTHARAFIVPARGFASSLEDVRPYDVAGISAAGVAADYKPQRRDTSTGSTAAPFACVAKLIDEGAGAGIRDDAMYHFAAYCMTQGLPEDLATDWCERVNEGFSPPLGSSQLAKCVRSAYARTERLSCRADWLQDFCPGGDRCYAPWARDDTGRDSTTQDKPSSPYPSDMTPEQRRQWRNDNDH